MQFDASALFAVGAGVGDILSLFRPGYTVTPFLHFLNEALLVGAALHRFTNMEHQLEFPALTAYSGTVLSGVYLRAALLVWC